MIRRASTILPILLVAFQAGSVTTARKVQTLTELTREPGGERVAILNEGLPVTIVEQGEGWTRVRIEGWVATADLEESVAPVVPVPAPLPAPAAASSPSTSEVSGSVFVVHEGKTLVGRGTAVRMLREPAAAQGRLAGMRATCDGRRAGLADEAARLKKTMDGAMRLEDTSAAFAKFDEAKWARKKIIDDLRSLDADCEARQDESMRELEAARVLSNDAGAFVFSGVAPGEYLLVALFEDETTRFAWEVPVALKPGERLAQDLTNGNLTRTVPVAVYK